MREAVDFLRYYAGEARRLFSEPTMLQGPTGESNALALHGRGPFACISPWNFPLAIFTGQIGGVRWPQAIPCWLSLPSRPHLRHLRQPSCSTKPAFQVNVMQLLPGDGRIGQALVADQRVRGVAFTGSNEYGLGDTEGAN